MAESFSMTQLAREFDLTSRAIRYYEQVGLLPPPERSEGNQRRYGRVHLERLAFIKHARDLGFTIEAIRELLDLSANPELPCADAYTIAVRQLQAVRDKIAKLPLLEQELSRIATRCHGDQVKDCYVIQSLANHELCKTEH